MYNLFVQNIGEGARRDAERRAVADIVGGYDFGCELRRLLHYHGPDSVAIAHDEHGRPVLTDGSGNVLPLVVSVSHCRTFAVVALSDGPVGVDAETGRPQLARVAFRFCLPGEAEAIADDPVCRKYEECIPGMSSLLLLWTAKEATFKAYHALCAARGSEPRKVYLPDIEVTRNGRAIFARLDADEFALDFMAEQGALIATAVPYSENDQKRNQIGV